MDGKGFVRWLKSAGIAAIGGGVMSAVAAAMDPTKWKFPQDLGSGKLWPFFIAGAGAMFGGMLLKSPWGQQAMGMYKDTQAQLDQAKADIDKAKAELKQPPSGPGKPANNQDKPKDK